MIVNSNSDTLQATKDDPRITKFGQFLRKTSIDELPQFINVFFGSMSVVGPRPHMLKHTEEYSKLIEKFLGRHYIKPGITGLAQCMGYRGETKTIDDMQNRVRLDRYYIENWSFWFDIKIIFLTIISLVRGSDKAF
jgi:putative colanic acid biosynthesis UDP-glucose lipid carrier transferase